MKIQFSIIVIFAALVAVVYGIPAHNDHIGRALMRRGVGITFSGSNHYTSTGIVVRTTKSNSNIKEAKATSFTPVSNWVPLALDPRWL